MRGGFFVPGFPKVKINFARHEMAEEPVLSKRHSFSDRSDGFPPVRLDHARLAADILLWAEPLARDRLAAFWNAAAPESAVARALADLHWRAWRCALSNLRHGAEASRRDLAIRARNAGLPPETIEDADEAVIDEIAEVIVARFRRSPALAKDYTKALVLTAAGLLAPMPAPATRAA